MHFNPSSRQPVRRGLLSAILLFAILFSGAPSPAIGQPANLLGASVPRGKPVRLVSVCDLAPTQFEAGFGLVDRMLESLREQASAAGTTWKRYVNGALRPEVESGQALPGVIDPDGRVRPVDGHHRVLLMQRIVDEMRSLGQTGFDFRLPIVLEFDYRGMSVAAWAADMERRGWGHFPAALAELPRTERYQRLPGSFRDITNSELRSILGRALTRLGADTTRLKPYVEFDLGRAIVLHGFLEDLRGAGLLPPGETSLPEGLSRNRKVTDLAIRRLLSDPGIAVQLMQSVPGPAGKSGRSGLSASAWDPVVVSATTGAMRTVPGAAPPRPCGGPPGVPAAW